MKTTICLIAAVAAAFAQAWQPQQSGSRSSLRGISAVNADVAWASGSGGTYLVTTDGGRNWTSGKVAGAEKLDFRAVHALDRNTAWLVSIGTGEASRVIKTTDGGATWQTQLQNPDAKGFFDGIAFWDPKHAVLVGDPVDGHVVVFTTGDGGEHWTRRTTPPAIGAEGAFAASNTSIAVRGSNEVWIATGGVGAARVFHSTDGGATWTVTPTPMRNDGAGAGIFSIYFRDGKYGIVVGGDYTKPKETTGNIAITTDGGKTWKAPSGTPPGGFRSAVVYNAERQLWLTTGPTGTDYSTDGGQNWTAMDPTGYNALEFLPSGAGWAVGGGGRIAAYRSVTTLK